MGNLMIWVICWLAIFCAVLTAGSAYIAGTSIKVLVVRTITSTLLAGCIGLIVYLWLQNRNYLSIKPTVSKALGQNIDIQVNEQETTLEDWKPLEITEIANDSVRVFPVRK